MSALRQTFIVGLRDSGLGNLSCETHSQMVDFASDVILDTSAMRNSRFGSISVIVLSCRKCSGELFLLQQLIARTSNWQAYFCLTV